MIRLGAYGHIGRLLPNPRQPRENQSLPQRNLSGNGERRAETLRQSRFRAGVFPGASDDQRVAVKSLTGVGRLGPLPGAPEKNLVHLVLQRLDAGADRRLGDVKDFRRALKTADARHFEKRPNLLYLHSVVSFELSTNSI